jgi:hypothetical protein
MTRSRNNTYDRNCNLHIVSNIVFYDQHPEVKELELDVHVLNWIQDCMENHYGIDGENQCLLGYAEIGVHHRHGIIHFIYDGSDYEESSPGIALCWQKDGDHLFYTPKDHSEWTLLYALVQINKNPHYHHLIKDKIDEALYLFLMCACDDELGLWISYNQWKDNQ